jgi:hypothetical protein
MPVKTKSWSRFRELARAKATLVVADPVRAVRKWQTHPTVQETFAERTVVPLLRPQC